MSSGHINTFTITVRRYCNEFLVVETRLCQVQDGFVCLRNSVFNISPPPGGIQRPVNGVNKEPDKKKKTKITEEEEKG